MNFKEIDTGEKFPKDIHINGYLGAPAIATALEEGADIVTTVDG